VQLVDHSVFRVIKGHSAEVLMVAGRAAGGQPADQSGDRGIHTCRRMLDLLFIAHERACETELAHLLAADLACGTLPDPGARKPMTAKGSLCPAAAPHRASALVTRVTDVLGP